MHNEERSELEQPSVSGVSQDERDELRSAGRISTRPHRLGVQFISGDAHSPSFEEISLL